MTDESVTQPEAAPAQPASLPAEYAALIAQEVERLSNVRIAGLQKSYDQKIAGLNKELARTRQLIEPEDPVASADSDEIATLRRQNAAYRAAIENPRVGPAYLRLLEAEDQMAVLEELQAEWSTPAVQAAPAPAPEIAEAPAPAPVDPNNPARTEPFTPTDMAWTDAAAAAFFERADADWNRTS